MTRRTAFTTLILSQLIVCAFALLPAVIYVSSGELEKGAEVFLACSLIPTPLLLWFLNKQLKQERRPEAAT